MSAESKQIKALEDLVEEGLADSGYWKGECRKHQERIRELESALRACSNKLGEYEDPDGGLVLVQSRQTLARKEP